MSLLRCRGIAPEDQRGQSLTRLLRFLREDVGRYSPYYRHKFAALGVDISAIADEAQFAAVRARGHEIIARSLGLLDRQLEGRSWLVGPYSLADAALFFIEMWGKRAEITLPDRIGAHFLRMQARPAVQRALAREGLTP